MYSAEDNPFHDANLGQQFSWHKKREKEKKMGISDEEAARRDQIRRLEAKVGSRSRGTYPSRHPVTDLVCPSA
jgi:hypothetical protein